jgi:hypothetical protein
MVAGQDDSHTGGTDPDEEIRNTIRPGLINQVMEGRIDEQTEQKRPDRQ